MPWAKCLDKTQSLFEAARENIVLVGLQKTSAEKKWAYATIADKLMKELREQVHFVKRGRLRKFLSNREPK